MSVKKWLKPNNEGEKKMAMNKQQKLLCAEIARMVAGGVKCFKEAGENIVVLTTEGVDIQDISM